MATLAANAVRYDLAQRKLNGAMARVAEAVGVPVPPPVGKTQTLDERHMKEAERMANYLDSVANALHQTGVQS